MTPAAKDKKKKQIRGFKVIENECIWMKAGVVNFHLCNNAYDCFDCNFDKAMTKAMGGRKAVSSFSRWADHFREHYNGAERPCRHVVTGRIQQPKICTNNYDCSDCAFDQMLDEMEISEAQASPDYEIVSGFDLARDYYYHDGHTWVRIEHGGMARVGFDAFVMKLFGKAALIPGSLTIGRHVKQGEPGWTIIQNNHDASVLSPVSGTVLSVNQRVIENPALMHDHPYQEGWLFIVEPASPRKTAENLKYGEESLQWMESEVAALMKMMGPEYEKMAATGGEPVNDFFGAHPEVGWNNLVHTFLKT